MIKNIQNILKLFVSEVSGGPVSNFYSFLQFHMHWGDSIERGSEHLVDGHPYAAEVWKTQN